MITDNILRRALKVRNPVARKILNKAFHDQIFDQFYENKKNRLESPILTFSFDIDFKEDVKSIPTLLEQLNSFNIKADFACIGLFVEKFKKEHKMIVKEGHDIINHTYSHPWNDQINPDIRLDELDKKAKLQEIMKCHDVCKNILGYEPIGFRMPHFGEMSPDCMYTVVNECGYKYSSSKVALDTPNAGLPYKMKSGLIEIPVSPCPKHPFGTLDSWHSLHFEDTLLVKNHRKEFFSLFKTLLDKGREKKTYINIYFDPMDVVKNKQFTNILEYAHSQRKKIKIITYEQALKRKDVMKQL